MIGDPIYLSPALYILKCQLIEIREIISLYAPSCKSSRRSFKSAMGISVRLNQFVRPMFDLVIDSLDNMLRRDWSAAVDGNGERSGVERNLSRHRRLVVQL